MYWQARANMVNGAGGKLAIACTIAVRYSCVRHQVTRLAFYCSSADTQHHPKGFSDGSAMVSYQAAERPILDYQMQLYRVMTQVDHVPSFDNSDVICCRWRQPTP